MKATNSKTVFDNKVSAVCGSIDKSVFDNIASTDVLSGGSSAYQTDLQAGEDALDKAISKFEDINPPAQYSDDWQTLLDDLSAIRDAYPKLGKSVEDISSITASLGTSSDPDASAKAQAQLAQIESDIKGVSQDLAIRATEISKISTRLGLDNSCDLGS